MKTTRKFEMNGKIYNSMMDIARDLGVKRVYPKDFEKLGIKEITEDDQKDDVQEVVDEKTEETKDTDVAEEEVAEDDAGQASDDSDDTDKKEDKPVKSTKTKTTKEKEPKKSKGVEPTGKYNKKRKGTPEEIEYAQDNVKNMTVIEFNNYIKHFTVEALIKMAETAEIDTWEAISNDPIRKMHLLMDIKDHYYPGEKTPVQPKTAWKKIPTDALFELVKENELEYCKVGDPRVQRMHLVMALNKAGITPPVLSKKEDKEEVEADA